MAVKKSTAAERVASLKSRDDPDLNEASALLATSVQVMTRIVAVGGDETDLAHAARCAAEREKELVDRVIEAKLRGGAA